MPAAYDCWLRAACLLGMAYHPLYGAPVDPRLVDALHLQMATFDRAMALLAPPGQKVDIPYEDTTLPGYFVRAPGHADEVRPVVIVGGGWDSTYVENYVGIGIAALRRCSCMTGLGRVDPSSTKSFHYATTGRRS